MSVCRTALHESAAVPAPPSVLQERRPVRLRAAPVNRIGVPVGARILRDHARSAEVRDHRPRHRRVVRLTQIRPREPVPLLSARLRVVDEPRPVLAGDLVRTGREMSWPEREEVIAHLVHPPHVSALAGLIVPGARVAPDDAPALGEDVVPGSASAARPQRRRCRTLHVPRALSRCPYDALSDCDLVPARYAHARIFRVHLAHRFRLMGVYTGGYIMVVYTREAPDHDAVRPTLRADE